MSRTRRLGDQHGGDSQDEDGRSDRARSEHEASRKRGAYAAFSLTLECRRTDLHHVGRRWRASAGVRMRIDPRRAATLQSGHVTRGDEDEYTPRFHGRSRVSVVGCDFRTAVAPGRGRVVIPFRQPVVSVEARAAAAVPAGGGVPDRRDGRHRTALLGQSLRNRGRQASARHALRRRIRPRRRQPRQRTEHGVLHVERRRHLHAEAARRSRSQR